MQLISSHCQGTHPQKLLKPLEPKPVPGIHDVKARYTGVPQTQMPDKHTIDTVDGQKYCRCELKI